MSHDHAASINQSINQSDHLKNRGRESIVGLIPAPLLFYQDIHLSVFVFLSVSLILYFSTSLSLSRLYDQGDFKESSSDDHIKLQWQINHVHGRLTLLIWFSV